MTALGCFALLRTICIFTPMRGLSSCYSCVWLHKKIGYINTCATVLEYFKGLLYTVYNTALSNAEILKYPSVLYLGIKNDLFCAKLPMNITKCLAIWLISDWKSFHVQLLSNDAFSLSRTWKATLAYCALLWKRMLLGFHAKNNDLSHRGTFIHWA